ncbi:DNA mismatch repair endonuclease MutL [Pantanalinema sp. GBBB05]|uniref:DNA mismatch repair endonuclease MutL n=1 Tax=Pantanalinema sp. GBBB05 TaxID=2604139 RepID=UPI001DCCF484|nr:DNA mismatch repair endonuclease MutL [Pantanalinema sp. GBBB05]
MTGIQPLPTEVIHLIAAGEVIDSLAAAVRELVENALDAAANRLVISVWSDRWRVRVADNGIGMNLENLQQAATPHSTSKIRTCDDLWRITSLGFRGEALHSLAQLAQLEIASRSRLEDMGWHCTYDAQGQAIQSKPAAISAGTIVTADQLFATWEARRQGLPPMPQQLRAIQSTIYHLALCHPHVTWQVQHNDRDWFQLFPGQTARQIVPQMLRDVQIGDLAEVEWGESGDGEDSEDRRDEGGITVQTTLPSSSSSSPSPSYLLLGLPDRCHRYRPDWVKVAVNGRFVQLLELEQTILSAFRRMLPRDRYPVCLVHLRVPPEQIDWNRTPAKSEVYLHHLERWQQQITQAIEQALRLNATSVPDSLYSTRIGQLLKAAEAEGPYYVASNPGELEQPGLTPQAEMAGLSVIRAIAQVHNMYILAEHPSGVWLIEQHIAHERVLYEQLCDRWQMVPLEPFVILNQLTAAQVEQLQRLGSEIEPFGEQVWAVRSAPAPLAARHDCAEALIELSLGGDLQTAQVATACRSAIRNGTPLSLNEMQTLLDQWQRTRNPRTCPHGRPICLTLEESALSRFFRRHWVIGKSHGI